MRAAALALALLAAACATSPRVQADPPFDLKRYDTFRWAPAEPGDPVLTDIARVSVSRWMARQRIFGAPDGELAVSIEIETSKAKRVMDFGERGFSIPGYEHHPGTTVPGFYPRYDVSVGNEGRVAIAIESADGVRWRGIAAGPVSDEPDRVEIDRLVRAALANAARTYGLRSPRSGGSDANSTDTDVPF